jgi:hypothetical protein
MKACISCVPKTVLVYYFNTHSQTRRFILPSPSTAGHGGQLKDRNGDEPDGQDEVLFPSDYANAGCITDDELYSTFVSRISPGVHVVAVIDSCHSGTAMDLPYVCQVGEDDFHPNERFNPATPSTALVPVDASTTTAANKQKKGKGKKGDKKGKKKKDGDSTTKKSKTGKTGTKKTKKNAEPEEDVAASTVDDEREYGEDGEDEMLEEVEMAEPKKRRGFLGVFGRGRK